MGDKNYNNLRLEKKSKEIIRSLPHSNSSSRSNLNKSLMNKPSKSLNFTKSRSSCKQSETSKPSNRSATLTQADTDDTRRRDFDQFDNLVARRAGDVRNSGLIQFYRRQIAAASCKESEKDTKEQQESYSRDFESHLSSSDAMGWGQPNGKRARHCSDENSSDFSGESESISKDMKSPFGKRQRDTSPTPVTEKASLDDEIPHPSSQVSTLDICHALSSSVLPGCSSVGNGSGGGSGNEYSSAECSDTAPSLNETSNGDTAQTAFNDYLIRTFKPKSPSSSRASSPMVISRLPTRMSNSSRKGPRVLSSRNRTSTASSFSRKSSNRKKKLTSQKRVELNATLNGGDSSTTTSSTSTTTSSVSEDEDEEDSSDDDSSVETESSKGTEDDGASATTSSSVDVVPTTAIARRVVPSLRPSYFPNVPPYMNFCLHDEKTEHLPSEIQKHLKWRLSPITPVVVKKTLTNSGFRLLRKTVEWNGQWGKHMKAVLFKSSMKDFQKLNHLPATFQIGRKDRLWRNIHRYMTKFGKEDFGFVPRTYVLPSELKQLKVAWDSNDGKRQLWIVKPPAGARGTGIRVVNKWNQVPKKKPVIVQSYIADPYLINDRKFDLRVYVLVTSFHPLKVYIYNDGLVRFAPVKYSHDTKRAGDRFMHLTNYSVNKNCELYTQNEDADACQGHKWTLKSLWRHFEKEGKDVSLLWDHIEEIVIKTLIAAEDPITTAAVNLPNRYNGYELFGFDIILDTQLKPWLLEVNISPSLHSSSPLDLAVKGPLITEVFNIAGFHLPPKYSPLLKTKLLNSLDVKLELETPVFDKRLYTSAVSKEEQAKHKTFKALYGNRTEYSEKILEHLTPDDIRQLITAEDELSQCEGFCRVFPSPTSHTYFPYFESPRYYNILFDAWEQKHHLDRSVGVKDLIQLCREKVHLLVPINASSMISENQECKYDLSAEALDSNNEEVEEDDEEDLADSTEQQPTQTIESEPKKDIESNGDGKGSSTAGPPLSNPSTVLDNITNNSNRSLVPPTQIGVCHEEELFSSNSKPEFPAIPNKVADYVKGVCY